MMNLGDPMDFTWTNNGSGPPPAAPSRGALYLLGYRLPYVTLTTWLLGVALGALWA